MPLVLTGDGAVGPLSASEVGFLDGVTSSVQTQINAKANDASQGFYFITSQAFSAASAVNVNNCFTSTYDWYRILVRTTASNSSPLLLRMRASGADATGADYYLQYLQAIDTVVSSARNLATTSGQITAQNTGHNGSMIDIFSPAIATPTVYFSSSARNANATTPDIFFYSGGHNLSTAYDGFTLFMASGTSTGTLRVYGYKN